MNLTFEICLLDLTLGDEILLSDFQWPGFLMYFQSKPHQRDLIKCASLSAHLSPASSSYFIHTSKDKY